MTCTHSYICTRVTVSLRLRGRGRGHGRVRVCQLYALLNWSEQRVHEFGCHGCLQARPITREFRDVVFEDVVFDNM